MSVKSRVEWIGGIKNINELTRTGSFARIILTTANDYLIGDKNQLLYVRGDILHNPKDGIVDRLKPIARSMVATSDDSRFYFHPETNRETHVYVVNYNSDFQLTSVKTIPEKDFLNTSLEDT